MNNAWLRKLAVDELTDTLFFATAYGPSKEKKPDSTILTCEPFRVQVFNMRKIYVNGTRCMSVSDAKREVQRYL